VFLVFFLGQSFWYDWRLALAGLGCLLIPAVLMVAVNLFQLRFQRKMIGLQNRLLALTFQIMTGISKIRVAGAEERSFARWAELFGAQRMLGTKARRLEVFLNTVMAPSPSRRHRYSLCPCPRSAADASYETVRFMAFWSPSGRCKGLLSDGQLVYSHAEHAPAGGEPRTHPPAEPRPRT
jgi:ATP-binding cassette subfamily C protein